MATITSRFKNAWNAFRDNGQPVARSVYGAFESSRPDRISPQRGSERSIISAIYNRIAVDVAQINIEHAYLDDENRYLDSYPSKLNECLNLSANLDQTGRALIQDGVLTMLEEVAAAIVPTDTDVNPAVSSSYDIYKLRVGSILEWKPTAVRLKVYNELTGKKQEIVLPKTQVALVENPFYSIMNEPNSMLQRLKRKLYLLDAVDEQSGSGKLDLIIQYPYAAKSPIKQGLAEARRKDIEDQIANSKLGIAYLDGTEHITQLNRSLENNLLKQVEYLTQLVFAQIGFSQAVLDGTASEAENNSYFNRIIEPIVASICDETSRKFLTKTALTQGQKVVYFRDPLKLVPMSTMAELADKLTRNEIVTSNEIRQAMGLRPAQDPRADSLINSNNVTESADAEHVDINGNPIYSDEQGGYEQYGKEE